MHVTPVRGQADPEARLAPIAKFIFEDGSSDKFKAGRGRFELVGLNAREKVDIELQYPPELANTLATAQSLDGAELSTKTKDAVIGADGTLALRLKVEDEPGLYRILVTAAGARAVLRFWVFDEKNPGQNPPMRNPRNK